MPVKRATQCGLQSHWFPNTIIHTTKLAHNAQLEAFRHLFLILLLSILSPKHSRFPFFSGCQFVRLSLCWKSIYDASGLMVSKGGGHFLPKFPLYLPFSWIPHRWFQSWQFAFLCAEICTDRNAVNNIFISREQIINSRLSIQIPISFNS